jgi:CO/xanthine dehydrogenase Mo-binding subunit
MSPLFKTAVLKSPVSRRAVLRGGGALIVSFSLAPSLLAPSLQAQERLPGALQNAPQLESWLRIGADGSITVFTGKCELGQGIKTALIQVAAEQLCVEPGAINLVTSDTAQTPAEGYTAGSLSMQDSGTAIMHACAQARGILMARGAERHVLPVSLLKAENGAIVAPDGKRFGYGELIADTTLKVRAQPQSPLIPPGEHRIVGQSLPRVDIPAKVTGQPAYVHDLRLPGMVHGRVVRPPSYGAKLVNMTVSGEKVAGVRQIKRDGNFLAVTAASEFRAIKAMEALAAGAVWEERDTMPAQGEFYSWLKQQPGRTIAIRDEKGLAPAPAVQTLEAEYRRPYQMHASIGPSCGVALYKDDLLTVWSHAQGMFPLRQAIAQLLNLPPERVRCIHMEGAGCYGHNGADDAAVDAAYLAFSDPGTPVRVQWMRHQEHQWEPYGAGMAMAVKGSVDAAGRITDWDYQVWTDTHSTRPGGAGSTLVGRHISTPFAPPPANPGAQPAGAGDRNIIPLYRVPNMRLLYHFRPHQAVRVSALRGLGAYANVFAIESFMDELAAVAGVDPVEFRLRHMEEPRAVAVIRRTATAFGWQSDARLPKGRGRGFAFSRYKNLGAYCAVAVELDVEHETGRVRLRRAVSACDSGQAVNPDGIRNQIEGGIIQAASWTLNEQVNFDRRRITSRDWSRYPILRFADMFDSIQVEVVDRPGAPFLGTGEASQGPTGAAIANAIAHATGKRLRELPLNPARVKGAIGV